MKFNTNLGTRLPAWPCCLKISLWLIGLISMTSLTVRDVTQLVKDYNDEEKNVATQVSINNKNLRLENDSDSPNVTVCLPYYSNTLVKVLSCLYNWNFNKTTAAVDQPENPCQEYEALENHSWGVSNLNYGIDLAPINFSMPRVLEIGEFTPAMEMPRFASLLLRKVINEGGGDDEFSVLSTNNSDWNQPLLDAVWLYLACLSQMGLVYSQSYACRNNINFTFIGDVSNKAIDGLYRRVLEAAGARIKMDDQGSANIFSHSAVSIFEYRFCFQVAVETYTRFDYEGLTEGNRPLWEGTGVIFEVYRDNSVLYFSREQLAQRDTPLYETQPAGPFFDSLQLKYSVESKFKENRTGKACSKDSTPALCLAKRRLKFAWERCGCTPFALRFIAGENSQYRVGKKFCQKPWHQNAVGKAGVRGRERT